VAAKDELGGRLGMIQ